MLKTLLERRLTNLDQHAKRMKQKYYPDWETMWKEGEIQYIIEESELKTSISMEENIKANDESDDDDESDDQIELDTDDNETSSDIPDVNDSVEKESMASDSKDVEIHLKKENTTKQTPTSKNGNYSLTSNKFLKQIASAEQNVKKLLQSPPKKQTNHTQASMHRLPKITKQPPTNYNK